MKKRRIMSERNRFVASLMFAAAAVISAIFLICVLSLDKVFLGLGAGSAIVSYAIFVVKEVALCFLSSVTVFYALIAFAFSLMTFKNNMGQVRTYGFMLSVLSAVFALFGTVVFCISLASIVNYNL